MVFIIISRYWSIAKSMTCQAFFRSERASSNLSKLMRTQAFWKYLWLAPCRAPCSNLFGHATSNSWRFKWPEGWALNVCGWELHSEAKWKFSIWLYLACILLIATHAPAYVQKTLRPSPICFTKKSNETWTSWTIRTSQAFSTFNTHTCIMPTHTHKLRAVWGPCRLDITWYHTLLSNTNLTTKGVWSVSARHAVLWLCLCCLKPMEKLETMFNKSLRCVLQLTVNQFCPFSGPPGYNIKNT